METEDVSKGMYGNMPMIQSANKLDTEFLDLKDLTPAQADKKVWVRARLQTSRAKGLFVNQSYAERYMEYTCCRCSFIILLYRSCTLIFHLHCLYVYSVISFPSILIYQLLLLNWGKNNSLFPQVGNTIIINFKSYWKNKF